MKRASSFLRMSIFAGLVCLFLLPSSFASAKNITGEWLAVSISLRGKAKKVPKNTRIILEFKKNGHFSFVHWKMKLKKAKKTWKVKRKLKGEWRLNGNVLVTTEKKSKIEESSVLQFSGNTVIMSRVFFSKDKTSLHLKKIR